MTSAARESGPDPVDEERPRPRVLRAGQVAEVHVVDVASGADAVVHVDRDVLLEAPNWTADGLLLNGDGVLWALEPVPGATPVAIEHEGLPPINNDHVVAPDGVNVFLSAMDGHLYRAPIAGGPAERVTSDQDVWHFLHGVSPEGGRLAYVRMAGFDEPGRLAVLDLADGRSALVDTGPGHVDGPEWSPDGRWIHFNTERWAERPGHAQLARVPDGGGPVERLVTSGTVDWFPHLSPDGRSAVYLEFPAGTEGHPADRPVALVVVATADWSAALHRIPVPVGGQGTINVNSWAPDSRRFAYVAYPTEEEP